MKVSARTRLRLGLRLGLGFLLGVGRLVHVRGVGADKQEVGDEWHHRDCEDELVPTYSVSQAI